MVDEVMNFLQLSGLAQNPPTNLAELIPYLIQCGVSLTLACIVFRLIGLLLSTLFGRHF